MNRMNNRLIGLGAVAALALLIGACDRGLTTAPELADSPSDAPAGAVLLQCQADVRAGTVQCDAAAPPPSAAGFHAARVIGGQDRYVRLSSAGTAYDGGTEIFSSTVRVQNLTRHYLGTTDGTTMQGVQIFFHAGPAVTSGTGSVTVRNPDGTGVFTASGQPYFQYDAILAPMEMSAGRLWEFDVQSTVNTFAFVVYVSAPMVDESALLLGPVWSGGAGSSDWLAPGNWNGGVPDSTMVATVPSDSLLGDASHPVLGLDATVRHLRVGTGSTLDLGGWRLDVRGNVDALGAVTNGTIRLTEAEALAGGTLPAVEVVGDLFLQRAVTATGPVSVSGSLHAGDLPLTIRIP